MWTGWPTNVSFQKKFCNIIEILITKIFNIQYLPHLWSTNFQIIFVKSFSLRAFQKYQEHGQIRLWYLVLTQMKFEWNFCSIFNNFSTVGWNIMKPLSTHQGGRGVGGKWFGRFPHDKQTKQTTSVVVDRFPITTITLNWITISLKIAKQCTFVLLRTF